MRCPFLLALVAATAAAADPYFDYLRGAPEFQRVTQDPRVMLGRWNTWVYMPWRYQWSIGTGDAGGQFCRDYGFNGGFVDHGEGPLDWLNQWQLRFYADHTAGKGSLYLHGANDSSRFKPLQHDARAVRGAPGEPMPLDAALLAKLQALVTRRVGNLKSSPMRVAYALDDEISWGVFVVPMPWRVNADDQAYADWLDRCYGGPHPAPQYVTPDFVLPQLGRAIGDIDFSPLLDRISYNASVWANFLGDLVTAANRA
ncbi:MAG: beta-galactosidase, partial [Armatimonadetes bacterium]|nr:beta-galactosidase [Armatimonadota bacterium]